MTLVVAADDGARHAPSLGLRLDRWVGDADSIAPAALEALRVEGVSIHRVDREKDASDTELAVVTAVEAGAERLTIIGALGGDRLDHAMVNLALLDQPALADRAAVLFDEHAARVSTLTGPGATELHGSVGDLVTLVPVGGAATGVTTRGLRYPLHGETLEPGSSRGLSNVRTAGAAAVSIQGGKILLIETPATVGA